MTIVPHISINIEGVKKMIFLSVPGVNEVAQSQGLPDECGVEDTTADCDIFGYIRVSPTRFLSIKSNVFFNHSIQNSDEYLRY